MKRSVRANLLLTLTALIWGAAFVAQDVAADSLGSFTFNGLRMALAALAMLPVIAAIVSLSPPSETAFLSASSKLMDSKNASMASGTDPWQVSLNE